MIVGLALLVGLLIASALGANLTRLADLRFRGSVLVFGALAIQAGIFTPLRDNVPVSWDRPLHVLSYVMILAFFVANVRVPAFWLVGFGLVANICVIFANGGRMPVSADAWRASGGDVSVFAPSGFADNNVLSGPGTHLRWLSDVFAVPPQIPLATVLSIGDLLIVIGMVAFVYRVCTPRTGVSLNGVESQARRRSSSCRPPEQSTCSDTDIDTPPAPARQPEPRAPRPRSARRFRSRGTSGRRPARRTRDSAAGRRHRRAEHRSPDRGAGCPTATTPAARQASLPPNPADSSSGAPA